MYQNAQLGGAGALAATGLGLEWLWMFLAAFALLAATLAIGRILPKREA